MFNFIGFLFSLLKGIYNTCAIHPQVNRQASVARILFAGFFGIFSSSINKILLDAQIKEYNTKIATRQITYDEEHNNIEVTATAPQLPPLPHNHPLSLVLRNFRNLANTHNPNFRPNISQSHTDLLEYQLNDFTVPCLPLSMILIAFNIHKIFHIHKILKDTLDPRKHIQTLHKIFISQMHQFG